MVEQTPPSPATDAPAVHTEERVVVHPPLWVRIAKWFGIALAAIAILLVVVLIGINTAPGKRFVAERIAGTTLANGLNVRIGRIEGSIYSAMVLRDVEVRDQNGVFARSPELRVDWRPFAFLGNHVDVRSLTSPLIRLDRLPELIPSTEPTDPDAPLLPDLDIDIGELRIDRLDIGAAVSGERHVARIAGTAKIADRRAQVALDAGTLNVAGAAGGDRVSLRLDAVPDDDRLGLALRVDAPQNGFIGRMASLQAPLALAVNGQGAWSDWRGKAAGTLGGARLLDLNLAARDGAIQVRGGVRPGLYLEGPVERLTAPFLQVGIDATLDERRADTRIALRSDALMVRANGGVDLGNSRFDRFRVEAMLLTPGAIADNLNGRSVQAAVDLNGQFATPTVDYKIQAAAIGFGDTVVERLYAEGRATVDSDRILIPVAARAARVSGLNAAVGGLVTNVTIAGDLAISGTQILSDNLAIRSDRINATAIVVADMATGRYTGALRGRVNNYMIDGIGIVDLETDADLYTAPAGGFGIRGRISARTQQIFNDGAREFLGGNAFLSAQVALDPDFIVNVSRIRMNAPAFRILDGSGRYDPAGPIQFSVNAVSNQYGPLVARATGTVTNPVVNLRAARPGLGVGLVDVNATLRGVGGRYAVVATGGSDYGPFSADVVVSTDPVLAVQINAARFAGMDITGAVRQTAAGPFAGQVRFAGSGVNGVADLGAEGRFQAATVSARANNAQIPGQAGLTIGRAIVDARVVLYDDAPAIVADAQLANFRSGEFVVQRGRARVNYRGGRGTAQLFAEGSTGVPFRVAANAQLTPEQYTVALTGRGDRVNFRTVNPARVRPEGGGYRLLPTRIDFDQGSVRLAGLYGNGLTMQARLDRMDLAVINGFVPGLGLQGAATGSLDFSQPTPSAFPDADARLTITNFRRTSLAAVSDAVNISFAGRLEPEGGDARAIIKRGTTTVGRMVARLNPLPPGSGSWTTRLLAAPLSGGFRYNGPADVLFSFAGLADQQLSGPLGVAVDFGGRVQSPQLSGVVRASNLTYTNEGFGTRLTNMAIDGRFTNDRFELVNLTARAGRGSVQAQGRVGLGSDAGFPINIIAKLDNAQLAESDALGADATGTIQVINDAESARVIGDLTIPEARYVVIRQGAAEVPTLTGVRRRTDPERTSEQDPRAASAGPPGLFQLNIRIRADNQLFVSGMGLESEWSADLRVRGTSAAPSVTGRADVIRGTYSFAGKRFELERGIVRFEGGPIGNPVLDILATTEAEGITASIAISGTGQAPRIAFTSTPALAQDEVLSRLLFGSSVTNLSATQAIQLAAALNSLRGSGGGGLNPLGELRSATGIDRLRILGADEASGRGTALAAGQYLTDDIYIEIITDARGFTATQLEVALSRALSVLTQTGSFGGSSLNVRYRRDY